MIILDYQDKRALYEQVEEKLKELIFREIIKEHSQLPSVRTLAMELSINPNTIQRAYAGLERENIIYSIKGKGSFVAPSQTVKEKIEENLSRKLMGLIKEARSMNIGADRFLEMVIVSLKKEGGKTDDRGSESNKTV